MPAEAIHLSALADSLVGAEARGFTNAPNRLREARLGAVLIDFPYFDRFALGVLRYLRKKPLAVSPWGDAFHQRAPVGIGKGFLRAVHRHRAHRTGRDDGERLLAIALGYFSHLAVDTAIHPLVNAMADARATRLGDRPSRQHNEVEKFQSILFHEERNGFDFMGRRELRDHIAVDLGLFSESVVRAAFVDSVQAALGSAPADDAMRRWTRGYSQYVALIASPIGKTMMPARVKDDVRDEVYAGGWGRFEDTYARAVGLSRTYMDAALGYAEDAAAEHAFDGIVVEGSIDDPPLRAPVDQ